MLSTATAKADPVKNLVDTIKRTGTSIVTDHPVICKDKQLMGRYEYKYRVIDQMTVCVANHKGNDEELRNTVLHEAVHIVQACNKGSAVYNASSLFKHLHKNELDFVQSYYPHSEFLTEIEARVIANTSNEETVTNLLIKYCLSK